MLEYHHLIIWKNLAHWWPEIQQPISGHDKSSSRDFGDSLQLNNWVLDSGVTCHMTPEVSDFIQGSLENTDKNIELADRHHVKVKLKVQV